MTLSTVLPSVDGKWSPKPIAKSAARHKRERINEAAKAAGCSVSHMRRCCYIDKYGSKEIMKLCNEEKLSVWKAYTYVKEQRQQAQSREYIRFHVARLKAKVAAEK